MKNKLIALVVALIAVTSRGSAAHAQTVITESVQVVYRYNLNSTTEIFCSLAPEVGPVTPRVADATSTTMTGTNAFASVAVGDTIRGVDLPANGGDAYQNSVVARASASSITINTAIAARSEVNPTLTSATLFYRTLTCGTGYNSGAFPISRYGKTTIQIDILQVVLNVIGTSTIDARIQCRTSNTADWLQVFPVLVPPAVDATYISLAVVGRWGKEVNGTYSHCRVGMKIDAADDGVDMAALAEQVSVSVKGSAGQ